MALINFKYLFNGEAQKCAKCGFIVRTTLANKLGFGDGGKKLMEHMDTHGNDPSKTVIWFPDTPLFTGQSNTTHYSYGHYRINPCFDCLVNRKIEYGHNDCKICNGNEVPDDQHLSRYFITYPC